MAVTEMTEARAASRLRITPVFWISLAVIFLVSLPNLLDPMIRHDDFPALLGEPEMFWNKTLHEGRWLNYLWHLREVITPAWLNFALYQICWAVYATALAVAATREDRSLPVAALMTALILVAPPATLISGWFNTLLPGLALVALYGVVVCRTPQRTARLLLPLFVVPTFMAYTTYPLLLLALCLAGTERRSPRDLIGLLMLFGAGFVGAVLITYALNWHVHGVFGVPLADWRQAEPAQSLAGLWSNLDWVWRSFAEFLNKITLGAPQLLAVHAAVLVGAGVIMTRRAPMELAYLGAGLLTGLALITLQAAKLGILVPSRAMIFAWVIYAVIVIRAAQLLNQGQRPLLRLGLITGLMLALAYGIVAHQRYVGFHTWQSQTRAVGAELARLPGPVHVFGRAMQSDAGRSATIQSEFALHYRIKQLSGHTPILCDLPGADCSAVPRPMESGATWQVLRMDGATVLIVPERDPSPMDPSAISGYQSGTNSDSSG